MLRTILSHAFFYCVPGSLARITPTKGLWWTEERETSQELSGFFYRWSWAFIALAFASLIEFNWSNNKDMISKQITSLPKLLPSISTKLPLSSSVLNMITKFDRFLGLEDLMLLNTDNKVEWRDFTFSPVACYWFPATLKFLVPCYLADILIRRQDNENLMWVCAYSNFTTLIIVRRRQSSLCLVCRNLARTHPLHGNDTYMSRQNPCRKAIRTLQADSARTPRRFEEFHFHFISPFKP